MREHVGREPRLRIAIGSEHEEMRAPQVAGEKVKEEEGRDVGGVQIVEDDDEELIAGELLQPRCRAIELAEADVAIVAAEEIVFDSERAQDLDPRPVRGCAARLPTPAPGDARCALRRERRDLVREARPADARLAGEEKQTAAPVRRLLDGALPFRDLLGPADEDRVPHARCSNVSVARTISAQALIIGPSDANAPLRSDPPTSCRSPTSRRGQQTG